MLTMTTATKVIQDELAGINITLFPKLGTRSIEKHADVDDDILYPILQKSILDELQVPYTKCQVEPYRDKKGRNHTPIGRVELKWHKIGFLVEHTDTFYVVESGEPPVVVKRTDKNDADNAARPLGLGAQNRGMA